MRWKFAGYPPAIHNLSNETRFEIVEGNKMGKLQEEDKVWKEVINWIKSTYDAGSDISETNIQSYPVCVA